MAAVREPSSVYICDANQPVAAALICFFADGGGTTPVALQKVRSC
ncbi:hypothetical protein ACLQ18_43690 [Streptomyces sp. DT193]